MAPRIFLLGASGYIGGHALWLLAKEHPEYQIVALARTDEQASKLKAAYPNIETAIGNLDSEDTLIREASKANVVINAASSDHPSGARSLIRGLGKGTKGHFIQISGTGILRDVSTGFGNETSKIYHDSSKADIAEIIAFDSTHFHHDAEEAIRTTAKEEAVPFVILSPPTIYGIGKGPINTRSIQIPYLAQVALQRGKAFQILEGQNIWNNVHVEDVASAVNLFTEEAVKGDASKVEWGDSAYYFVDSAEHKWGDVSSSLAKILHDKGKLPTAEVDKLSVEEVSQIHPWGALLWGGNCRSRAEHIRELGWAPKGPDMAACLEQMVDVEIAAFEAKAAK